MVGNAADMLTFIEALRTAAEGGASGVDRIARDGTPP